MNTVGGPPPTKRTSAYLPNLRRKSGQSPDGAQGDMSPIVLGQATVSTTAVVSTRHPQCPVVTPVGTEGANTVTVAAKADGRSTSSDVLTPQRSFATGAKSNNHRLQHVGCEETKHDELFRSPLSIGCTRCFLLLDTISIHKKSAYPAFLKETI